MEVQYPVSLSGAALSPEAIFTPSAHTWRFGTDVEIFDATLAALRMGYRKTLTMRKFFRFPGRLWLARTPRRLFKLQVPARASRTLHTGDMLDVLSGRVEPDVSVGGAFAKRRTVGFSSLARLWSRCWLLTRSFPRTGLGKGQRQK